MSDETIPTPVPAPAETVLPPVPETKRESTTFAPRNAVGGRMHYRLVSREVDKVTLAMLATGETIVVPAERFDSDYEGMD